MRLIDALARQAAREAFHAAFVAGPLRLEKVVTGISSASIHVAPKPRSAVCVGADEALGEATQTAAPMTVLSDCPRPLEAGRNMIQRNGSDARDHTMVDR